jgi:hypothetical protein
MAEVLAQFDTTLASDHGVRYRAQACGAPTDEGVWEGWIEFVPLDGGTPVRSPRETTQPNRADAVYWATGLTAVYLEGALDRALNPRRKVVVEPPRPLFDSPAPDPAETAEVPAVSANAVLDPFSVYEKGEHVLRAELSALSAWHLVNIIVAYRLSDEPVERLKPMSRSALADLITARVREQLAAAQH